MKQAHRSAAPFAFDSAANDRVYIGEAVHKGTPYPAPANHRQKALGRGAVASQNEAA
jgi:hypothetical protein